MSSTLGDESVAHGGTALSTDHDFGTIQDVGGDGAGDSGDAPNLPVFTAN